MKSDIALLGCGAIAQLFYLPALARNRHKFEDIWLVDPSDRALALATAIVPGKTAHSYSDIPRGVPLVVVATPNKFHVSLALEALAQNADVLIEKPFAISPKEGKNLIETATKAGRIVAVNQTRRFIPYMRDLRRRVEDKMFGPLMSIVHQEGYFPEPQIPEPTELKLDSLETPPAIPALPQDRNDAAILPQQDAREFGLRKEDFYPTERRTATQGE